MGVLGPLSACNPHEAKNGTLALDMLGHLVVQPRVVAVGECGLDYFYNHSLKAEQITMLRAQIELALEHDKPLIFHVREAFDDFWPIFNDYKGVRGVLHSFTDTRRNLDIAVSNDLYIGVNGISTFTKVEKQIAMYKHVPLQKILLETDAPFLTPVPKRGKVNEPAYVTCVAHHLAALHTISLKELAGATTSNATNLLYLKQTINRKA